MVQAREYRALKQQYEATPAIKLGDTASLAIKLSDAKEKVRTLELGDPNSRDWACDPSRVDR